MQTVAPAGPMYQAGTLSGNPLAMAAGIATLRHVADAGLFGRIAQRTQQLADGLRAVADEAGVPLQVGSLGTMFGFYFLKEHGQRIASYADAKQFADTQRFARCFWAMLDEGVYLAPSQFEAGFVSAAHGEVEIAHTLNAARAVFNNLKD
jgi:glutamate-1-semialdehyde 2,1-aminomutase